MPSPLRWFTANIGVHHIHHLCSRIPCYQLPLVLRDHPELDGMGRLTLFQSLRCVRLVLWDEGQQRLISFREARRHCASIEGGPARRQCVAPGLEMFGPRGGRTEPRPAPLIGGEALS